VARRVWKTVAPPQGEYTTMNSIACPVTVEQPHFEQHKIVMWHIARIPVPGVVIAANDELQQATIKVRTLDGETRVELVSYDEIEMR
jgi:hypothetical protein